MELVHTSKHLIAYLDILGTRKRLISNNRIENDKNISILKNFILYAKNGYSSTGYLLEDIDTICFSDNLLVAYDTTKAKESNELFYKCQNLIIYIMCLQGLALTYGFLIRGVIGFDELYLCKEENFVCGTGLVNADEIEKKIAIYPRIITYDKELLKRMKTITINGQKLNDIFIKDFDNIHYLNYLQMATITKDFVELLKTWHDIYLEEMIKERTDKKIIQKHDWHINYYNSFCDKRNYSQYKIDLNNIRI